jgi:hypothetical protein
MSISLAVSLVYQDREPTRSAQAVCPQSGFVTTPSLATLVETFQPSLLGYAAASAGAVVATDPAPRSTSIRTTALPFSVRFDAEGGMDLHIVS